MTADTGAPLPPKPPKRPSRPQPPAAPQRKPKPKLAGRVSAPVRSEPLPPNTLPAYSATPEISDSAVEEFPRHHPIAPPDAKMQFRAIGVVEGRYVASEEQFTRGTIYTPDGSELDAVLLGRVMSLVRKYLQPDKDYLWVVYPRTGTSKIQERLHVQVAGVWAPDEMNQDQEDASGDSAELGELKKIEGIGPRPTTPQADPLPVKPDYFSIRGEIIRLFPDNEGVVVKIVQNARKQKANKSPSAKQKASAFKLRLQGILPPNAPGQFWDLEVLREDCNLKIVRAELMGAAPKPPPKKRRKPKLADGDHPRSRGPREKPIIKKAQKHFNDDAQADTSSDATLPLPENNHDPLF